MIVGKHAFDIPPVAYRSDRAQAMIQEVDERVGAYWRERAIVHLIERKNRELRAGLPMQMPSDEDRAMAIIRGLAGGVEQHAAALEQAAVWLKNAGKASQASQIWQAAQRARQQATELIGE